MKKVMTLITLTVLGFSNAMLASSLPSLVDRHSNNFEEVLTGQVHSKNHHCHKCRRGPRGHRGPQGIPGPLLNTFISLFALEQQTIAAGDPILFNAASAQAGPITWPGTNHGEIIIYRAGTYQISFGAQPLFAARISLRVNNVNVPGGTVSIDIGIPFSGLTMDVVIPANSTISLVNTSNASFSLQSAGPDPEATIAFLEIYRIL